MKWRKPLLPIRASAALALGALGAVLYLALLSAVVSFFPEPFVEAASPPCRPSDARPECQPSPPPAPQQPAGPAFITVRLGWANTQLLLAHTRGIHSVVQWQSPDGRWNDVREWQYNLTNSAVVRWGVLERDFNRGPFRWLISDAITREPLAASKPFNLPGAGGDTISTINIGAPEFAPAAAQPAQIAMAVSGALQRDPINGAPVIAILAPGTPLAVLEAHPTGLWLRVRVGVNEGWVQLSQTSAR